jgi:DNA-binding Lrp family transcriptional regulator
MITNDEPSEAAFILLTIEIGSKEKIIDALKNKSEVKAVHQLYGVYDIIARMESDTMLNLKDAISRIRRLREVRSVQTMIVTHAHAVKGE